MLLKTSYFYSWVILLKVKDWYVWINIPFLKQVHPSHLSAYNGFFNCFVFKQIDEHLINQWSVQSSGNYICINDLILAHPINHNKTQYNHCNHP